MFLVEPLKIFICKIMSSANKDNFTSLLLIWMSFISLSCLITPVRTSNAMLNKTVRVGILVLFLSFNLALLSIILAVGLWHMTFIYPVCSFYTHFFFFKSFYHESMLYFFKCFFLWRMCILLLLDELFEYVC